MNVCKNLAVKWGKHLTPQCYERGKLLATLRLSGVTLSKLQRISGSINTLIML
jgi:hypothetical protein